MCAALLWQGKCRASQVLGYPFALLAHETLWSRQGIQLTRKFGSKITVPNITDFKEYTDAIEEADTAEKLCVLKFCAEWCQSCKAIDRKYAVLSQQNPQVRFYKVDFDKNSELCQALGITHIPAVHIHMGINGRVEEFTCGPQTFHKVRETLQTYDVAGLDHKSRKHNWTEKVRQTSLKLQGSTS
ncbi:unnamed protein product [Heterosigma akashiwo]|mmetsp:Transcript_9789/g.15095  ORF Transcript_9789/g.15095 Transcript_9789/m.15095 type:complete len:185 (+) Transcript_9789:44-598(+)